MQPCDNSKWMQQSCDCKDSMELNEMSDIETGWSDTDV